MRYILVLSALVMLAEAQRPSFAGSGPIGRPGLHSRFKTDNASTTSTTVLVENRVGEDGSTQKIPVDARGDVDLVNTLNSWDRDHRPFWLLNADHIERARNTTRGTQTVQTTVRTTQLNNRNQVDSQITGGRFGGSQGNLQGSQGSLQGSQGNLQGSQGNLQGSQGNLQGSQGNLQGSQGNLYGSQGNLQGSQGNLQGSQGGFLGNQGGFLENQGSFQGNRANIQGVHGRFPGIQDSTQESIGRFPGSQHSQNSRPHQENHYGHRHLESRPRFGYKRTFDE